MARKTVQLVVAAISVVVTGEGTARRWDDVNLHPQHLPFFFNSNPTLADECHQDPNCPYKVHLRRGVCWGYETNCTSDQAYSYPSCPGGFQSFTGWVQTKEEQIRTFYEQGDFGYVQQHRQELRMYCHPEQKGDSSLECSDHLRFCRGRNLFLDLRRLPQRRDPVHYSIDVLQPGEIGGHCRLDREKLQKQCDMISALQSWGPELRNFARLEEKIIRRSPHCDVWVDKPAYIMKLDATVNMYHHFCDFFNLYASQHVNNTDEWAFSTDNQILVWQTIPHYSNFAPAFDAFTKNPVWNLSRVSGKRVCFREVVFPLLPRMIFGLFYNTPLIWGCESSGLFHAFSGHLLHRLGVPQRTTGDGRVHITLLSRATKHRRILNQDQLISALQKDKTYVVQKAEYTHQQDLRLQLAQDQWTDVFVAMHGAGLTHLLFLPDWAVVFELYNCGDPNCYNDLARLRGIKYITWEDKYKLTPEDEGHHPDLGAHEKFTNYYFDEGEFTRLVGEAAKHVRSHHAWQNLQSTSDTTHKHTEL